MEMKCLGLFVLVSDNTLPFYFQAHDIPQFWKTLKSNFVSGLFITLHLFH